jgi:hypothetical protein
MALYMLTQYVVGVSKYPFYGMGKRLKEPGTMSAGLIMLEKLRLCG